MGRWVMDIVVENLRNTIVLVASMLGFAAQAAPYVPLGGADRDVGGSEIVVEDVYRAKPPVEVAPASAPSVAVQVGIDSSPVPRLDDEGMSWRERARWWGERVAGESDATAVTSGHLAAFEAERARTDAHGELTHAISSHPGDPTIATTTAVTP